MFFFVFESEMITLLFCAIAVACGRASARARATALTVVLIEHV